MLTHALTLCTTVLLLAVTNAENRRVQQIFPSAQQQGLNNEEKEYQRNPAKSAEKLDPRATWYIPGGQPTFPKLVYALKYGWREVSDEEHMKQLVKNEESEPLYWIVRALPCAAEPIEGAKVFTTENGQAYAYYGRPELVTLKGEKP
ncbi:unnamed protein product, partial [Mesorhabditis spiculigera]